MTDVADRRREGGNGPQEVPAEYEQSQVDRQVFNAAAWSAALAARQEMPTWRPEWITEQPAQRIGKRLTEPVLIPVSGQPDRVRKTQASVAPEIELQVIEIEQGAEEADDFGGGALVVPVAPERLTDVDPRSLALHRWDEEAEQYNLIPGSGFDLSAGYVYGRIAGPGR